LVILGEFLEDPSSKLKSWGLDSLVVLFSDFKFLEEIRRDELNLLSIYKKLSSLVYSEMKFSFSFKSYSYYSFIFSAFLNSFLLIATTSSLMTLTKFSPNSSVLKILIKSFNETSCWFLWLWIDCKIFFADVISSDKPI